MIYRLIMLFVLFGLTANGYAANESVESVESRGVEQKFLLTRPNSDPVANVILLAGGHGKLSLGNFFGSPTIGWGRENFLVRTREAYADHGFLIATMDAPTNRKKMNAIWRMGDEHAKDIQAVAAFLKQQADVPVWIIGTSMGTFSAANAGIRAKNDVNGVVLTSSVTRSKKKWAIYSDYPYGVVNMGLDKISAPVLVVSHKDDGCKLTPASDIDLLADQLSASKKVEKALVSGGDHPRSGPCNALSQHGFLGIEQEVVDIIAAFIKSN